MKRIAGLAVIVATLILGTGCASKQEVVPQAYNWQQEIEGAPEWVTSSTTEGLSVIASAKITNAGLHFAEVEATSLAKDKIARQLESKIHNMTKNFTQTTGAGEQAKVDKVVTDVSRQLSKQVLYNVKVQKRWISKTGTMWVLVSGDSEQLKSSVKSSFSDANAKHQQVLAKETLQELDTEIEKKFLKRKED